MRKLKSGFNPSLNWAAPAAFRFEMLRHTRLDKNGGSFPSRRQIAVSPTNRARPMIPKTPRIPFRATPVKLSCRSPYAIPAQAVSGETRIRAWDIPAEVPVPDCESKTRVYDGDISGFAGDTYD
jgi:hypothetical protein